jgi:hypothetical protein
MPGTTGLEVGGEFAFNLLPTTIAPNEPTR